MRREGTTGHGSVVALLLPAPKGRVSVVGGA